MGVRRFRDLEVWTEAHQVASGSLHRSKYRGRVRSVGRSRSGSVSGDFKEDRVDKVCAMLFRLGYRLLGRDDQPFEIVGQRVRLFLDLVL
jgi:hypothetical protein